MVNLKIEVNKTDLRRIQRALDHVVAEGKRQQDRLPMMCAMDMKGLLIKNLLGQKFAGSYPAYDDRYAEWKAEMGMGGEPFWRLYGDTLNNIDAFKIGDSAMSGYFAGIRAGVFDQGGKSWYGTPQERKGKPKEIAMYARKAETLRPLFRPTHEEYKRDGHSLRGQEALFFIKNRWK